MTDPVAPGDATPPVAHPLLAYQVPVTPPPGCGSLVTSANRGPYLIAATSAMRLKIDGHQVPIGWHIVLPAGPHEVKVTDIWGVPYITTALVVQPGATHQLRFDFGVWRNRVYDGSGADVTRFGLWSNYVLILVVLVPLLLLTCSCFGLIMAGGLVDG